MANAATSGHGLIELSITAHPEGRVSQHLRRAAKRGQTVGLTPAQGTFTLPEPNRTHLLLISGGSGITPVMSMLRTRCALGWSNPVTFLHYAPTESDMLYRDELAELARTAPGLRVVRVFTDEPGTGDLDGFLTRRQLDRRRPRLDGGGGFRLRAGAADGCGPVSLRRRSAGPATFIPRRSPWPSSRPEAGAVDGTVRFGASEMGVASDGRPLLVQAEAAGLAPLSGCRMGICHTCTRHLCSGVVRDAVTGDLATGPDVDVRICVSVPIGDVEIDL